MALTLLILAAAVLLVTLHLRKAMRVQLIQQDGIALYAASLVPHSIDDELDPESASDPLIRSELLSSQVLDAASANKDVLGVRVFDSNGKFQMAIPWVDRSDLTASEQAALRQSRRLSFFDGRADLFDFGHNEHSLAPVIRALVPLEQDGNFLGAAEFVLDGSNVAAALRALDRDLLRYALLIFILAGGVISLSLGLAFARLNRANKALRERTQSLLKANHELTLAAKTSAVGAITAHLIHDLKSPLFGLRTFVSSRADSDDEDWNVAIRTADRMQKLISDVVRLLQEDKTSESYEISASELMSLLRTRVDPQARTAGVQFTACTLTERVFVNRDANVLLLVITNIVQNALQATPQNGRITVELREEGGALLFEIADTGPGLPEHIRENLFTPCRSTKSGGTGIGLAISKQLAQYIGAELTLARTSSDGTVFHLRVPERVNTPEEVLV